MVTAFLFTAKCNSVKYYLQHRPHSHSTEDGSDFKDDQCASQADCWAKWISENGREFPDLTAVIQINLLFGANSSVVERFFSTNADVMTKKRNRLASETAEKLSLVAKNEPPLKKFKSGNAVAI
jgi:hypothetical protein